MAIPSHIDAIPVNRPTRPKLSLATRARRPPNPRTVADASTATDKLHDMISEMEARGHEERAIRAMTPTDTVMHQEKPTAASTRRPKGNQLSVLSAGHPGINLQDILNQRKQMNSRKSGSSANVSHDASKGTEPVVKEERHTSTAADVVQNTSEGPFKMAATEPNCTNHEHETGQPQPESHSSWFSWLFSWFSWSSN